MTSICDAWECPECHYVNPDCCKVCGTERQEGDEASTPGAEAERLDKALQAALGRVERLEAENADLRGKADELEEHWRDDLAAMADKIKRLEVEVTEQKAKQADVMVELSEAKRLAKCWEEDARRFCKNADFWREKAEGAATAG